MCFEKIRGFSMLTRWAKQADRSGSQREGQLPLSQAEPLVLTGVSAGYSAEVPIVRGIDLTVAFREIVCITGPNGSGKSTLLKAILGYALTLAGDVTINGNSVLGLAPDKIGYVPQYHDVFGPMSVMENLEMGGYMLGRRELSEQIEQVINLVPRLGDLRTRTANRLSGGERKMVAIGRVLMSSPKLLVLDEPTAGLSPQATEAFVNEQLAILPALDRAVLIVEQKAMALRKVADRALILVAGSVRLAGRASDILTDEMLAGAYLT
jgi:ABC-type branched-subunit amino acid transport system ATPase component